MDDLMIGTWVGSFSSFVHDLPPDRKDIPGPDELEKRPPHLGAYYLDGGIFTQTNGYYAVATLLCLKFLGNKKLEGWAQINRGGRLHADDNQVTGNYDQSWNVGLGIHQGAFTTFYGGPSGIQTDYRFLMKDMNEIEWIWWTSREQGKPYRGTVAQGTLRRVLLAG